VFGVGTFLVNALIMVKSILPVLDLLIPAERQIQNSVEPGLEAICEPI
jgi:hypothetical protein